MSGQPRRSIPPWVVHGLWALALVSAGYSLDRAIRLGRHALSLYERGYVNGLAREPMVRRQDLETDTDPE